LRNRCGRLEPNRHSSNTFAHMSEESLSEFMKSKLFAECLETLSKPGVVSAPVNDPFVEQLIEYARTRVASVSSERLEANLASFKRGTALRIDLTIDETEGYVDVQMGDVNANTFVPGEFSGTAFEFDAANADRTKFPLLRRARSYSADKEAPLKWRTTAMPSSQVMHAVTLLTVGRAAQALVEQLKKNDPVQYLARVMQTSQRDFVCDAPKLF
jgi:hypothetical protein